jgi:SAM-dependent methyltransferase
MDFSRELVRHYSQLFDRYGDSPQACQYPDYYAQAFRFLQLMQVGDLNGKSVLDLGCGKADLYDFLLKQGIRCHYTGIDLVPGFIDLARVKYPEADFYRQDIRHLVLDSVYDYIMINGVFNNHWSGSQEDHVDYMQEILKAAFSRCRVAMAFNFISSYVDWQDPALVLHEPERVMSFCLNELSRKVVLMHFYEEDHGDTAVFVYR